MKKNISKKILNLIGIIIIFSSVSCSGKNEANIEIERLSNIAKEVSIIRDDYGVPHIYGKTDAQAVFGLLYAQAEDDFPRIERNYIWASEQ